MATSGVSTYSPNHIAIVKQALELVGHIRPGGRPNAEDIDSATSHLNSMLRSWSTMMAGVWLSEEASISLVEGTASYSTAKRYQSIIEARIRNSDDQDLPLHIMGLQEYREMVDKEATGKPVQVFYLRGATGGTLTLWPTPDDDTDALIFTGKRQLYDMIALQNEFDLPAEWMEAITYGLAARIGIVYGADPGRMSQIKSQAAESLQVAMWSDVEETSVYIQPDMQGW